MDLTIISTYRCNSKCQMCYIWKYPSNYKEEVTLETLDKLPNGFDNINISGGEPTLRKDLLELIETVYSKGRIIEISSNGLNHEKIIPIIKKFPNIKIRFSLEGNEITNNTIRGEQDGYKKKINGLMKLKELGGTDLGFAFVIQDENVEQLVHIYNLSHKLGFELATSTLHNAFQFHKNDNYFYNRVNVAKKVEELIIEQLKTNSVKNWFRAYLNLGLIEKILGHERLIKCTAGEDFIFIDPWSDVYACNVRNDLLIGNLENNSWSQLINSEKYKNIIMEVKSCKQNCWMVTTARTAMRSRLVPVLPKMKPLNWVIYNKIRLSLGEKIQFENYINYNSSLNNPIVKRISYLDKNIKKIVTPKDSKHYLNKVYFNE